MPLSLFWVYFCGSDTVPLRGLADILLRFQWFCLQKTLQRKVVQVLSLCDCGLSVEVLAGTDRVPDFAVLISSEAATAP